MSRERCICAFLPAVAHAVAHAVAAAVRTHARALAHVVACVLVVVVVAESAVPARHSLVQHAAQRSRGHITGAVGEGLAERLGVRLRGLEKDREGDGVVGGCG